jgi:transcriptional regulator with XRE-family HTH domain
MGRKSADNYESSEIFVEVAGAVGRKIAKLREERGLSQRQFAAIAEVSGPHFGLVEAGVGNVSLLVLIKIATALGVGIVDLFEGAGGPKRSMDSAIVRLAGSVNRVEQLFDRRRDEMARYNEELREFLDQYQAGRDREQEKPPSSDDR